MLPHYNDATMWGPQGEDPNAPRKRLNPGDRLADGTVYAGADEEGVLAAELKEIEKYLKPLETRREALLLKLSALNPDKYGIIVLGVEAETARLMPPSPPALTLPFTDDPPPDPSKSPGKGKRAKS